MYRDIIIRDDLKRIIYQEREDGFYEKTTYKDDGSIKIETHYPAGQVEIERYNEKFKR